MELLFRYLNDRGHNRVPLMVLLWRDMFIRGTIVNLVFLGLALWTVYLGYPDWSVVVVFFLPMPYNIFIWSAVWRAAGRMSRIATWIVRALGSGWLAITIVV